MCGSLEEWLGEYKGKSPERGLDDFLEEECKTLDPGDVEGKRYFPALLRTESQTSEPDLIQINPSFLSAVSEYFSAKDDLAITLKPSTSNSEV